MIRRYTITQNDDGSFYLDEETPDSRWPQTRKATDREVIARLMQLMSLGPVAPQIEPEVVCISTAELAFAVETANGIGAERDELAELRDDLVKQRNALELQVREIIAWFDVMASKYDGEKIVGVDWPDYWLRQARETIRPK